jgi:hypothetical protein
MFDDGQLMLLGQMRHPMYNTNQEWTKWRDVMTGGKQFLDKYLYQFSDRETSPSFENRKKISYVASYARSAVEEIINAVFQRLRDITRVGGPDSYAEAIAGTNGGVNREGMSMNMFMGTKVLPELLGMGKVGIFIDMPNAPSNATLAETYRFRPYLYHYPIEDILNWNYTNEELRAVLLRDSVYTYDDVTGLPNGTTDRYRYLWQADDGFVHATSWQTVEETKGKPIIKNRQEYKLGLKRIPFVLMDIGQSLLNDVSNHQIALTNLESSDIGFCWQANFPMYVEQHNSVLAPTNTKMAGSQETVAAGGDPKDIAVGPLQGRKYPKDMDAPSFIHPSPEPLKASMEKQVHIQMQIRHLVHLSVTKLNPQRESADSKRLDDSGLEAGLAKIGLILENGEKYLAERYVEYIGDSDVPTVKYPSQYSLLSDAERRNAAKEIIGLCDDIPSTTGRKALKALAIQTLLDGRLPPAELDAILTEIANAKYVSGRTEDIERDKKEGLVDAETASIARGYAPGTAAAAKSEYEERLKFINETQSRGGPGGGAIPGGNPAARGVADKSANPALAAQTEKDKISAAKDQQATVNSGGT